MGWFRDTDENELAQRQAAAEEEERRSAERFARFEAETGYRNLARDPWQPSWLLCVRCGVMAQNREIHDEWHRSMGQEWTP
jgi:hypothetical protein